MRKEIWAIIKHVPLILLSYREGIYGHLETVKNQLWPISDCSRNESRLVRCGEGEVCATIIQRDRPESGMWRHLQNYFIGVVKPFLLLSIHWRPVSKGQCQCRGLDGKETLCLDANHLWMTEESANVGVSERSDNIDPWPLIMISECHHTCFIFSRARTPPLDMRTSLQHQHIHWSSSKLSSDTNDFSWKWSVFKGVLHCSRFK